MDKNTNFDIVSVLANIFNNPDTDYIIRLYNTPIEEFDTEFNKIINEFEEGGNESLIKDFNEHKEVLRNQAIIFNKYQKLDEEREKRTRRAHYKTKFDEAYKLQFSDSQFSQLLGDILTIQSYLHHVNAVIEKGEQSGMVKNIYKRVFTHLLDLAGDVMSLAQLEMVNLPQEVMKDISDLSLGVDKEFDDLCKEYLPEITHCCAGESICQ